MQKKSLSKSKISQEEIQQRLTLIKAADELEKVKHDMEAGVPASKSATPDLKSLGSISGAGESSSEIYNTVLGEYRELLTTISNYTFASELRKHYFKENKIRSLLSILKKAGMTLHVRSMMDIFKDRVKQRNNGTIPTIKEKGGLFSKSTTRPMKVEEIASKYEVEVDLPPGTDRPLTVCGTQIGLLNHLREILFEDEEVQDLLKKNPRKAIARFLSAAKLINLQTSNGDEKCLVASLITPDSIQPKSPDDREGLLKFRNIVRRAKKWTDSRLELIQKKNKPEKEDEQKPEKK